MQCTLCTILCTSLTRLLGWPGGRLCAWPVFSALPPSQKLCESISSICQVNFLHVNFDGLLVTLTYLFLWDALRHKDKVSICLGWLELSGQCKVYVLLAVLLKLSHLYLPLTRLSLVLVFKVSQLNSKVSNSYFCRSSRALLGSNQLTLPMPSS